MSVDFSIGSSLSSSPGAQPDGEAHVHRSAKADERVWLETLPDQAASMRLHSFCVECGAVRSRLPARGRSIGFFHNAIANLKAILDHHPNLPKLAQVHSHLIAKALASISDFGDPYSMSYEVQWAIFLRSVQRVRPDLPVDLIEYAMPREPFRRRRPFIDLSEENRKGVESPRT